MMHMIYWIYNDYTENILHVYTYNDTNNILNIYIDDAYDIEYVMMIHIKYWIYNDDTYNIIMMHTSSTAQGGGGSFKNRKPIGEIGCCESGMAERSHWWTERCLISLTLSLSFSDYLPAYQPIFYVSTYLSHYLSF